MSRHINTLIKEKQIRNIGSETWIFVISKIATFYKYYIGVILIQIFVRDLFLHHTSFTRILTIILKGIPNYLLVYMGLNYGNEGFRITGMWYLSAMVIALFLLYPWALKNYDFALKWLYPVISLFIIGYLYHSYNTISNWTRWSGITFNGILRAVAEIAFGASLFPLSQYLAKNWNNSFFTEKFGKTAITILKLACYISVFIFSFGSINDLVFGRELDLYFFFVLALGIVLSFSNVGYRVPDCGITRLLGKYSLGIYIFHHVGRSILNDFFKDITLSTTQYALFIIVTIISCIIFMYITDFVARKICHKPIAIEQSN